MRKKATDPSRTAKKAYKTLTRGRPAPLRILLGVVVAAALVVGSALGFAPHDDDQQSLSPKLQQSVQQTIEQHEVLPVQGNADPSADGHYYIYASVPDFGELTDVTESFEYYSPLDSLGRCGAAIACLGRDLMPTEERGSIAEVKPTGWQSARYDFVDGGSLYNRSHLIAFSLAGENANERNLITGTRQLNLTMADFEVQVANYIRSTGNHVLYRVTPVFEGTELVARGVQLEALSVEDGGRGICVNAFIPNAQEGVGIDYANGNNWFVATSATQDATGNAASSEATSTSSDVLTSNSADSNAAATPNAAETAYVLNTSSKRFHQPWCDGVKTMSAKNKQETDLSRDELIAQGYKPCGSCNP